TGTRRQPLRTGPARKAALPGWPAAGKTGPSQDFRDAWFIGYTSHLVTGVWLGNDDSSPTKKATGSGLPVEIWSRFMKVAHQNQQIADLPGLRSTGWFGAPSGPTAAAAPVDRQAPGPVASAGSNARPEPEHGLDGWFLQRLFGRR